MNALEIAPLVTPKVRITPLGLDILEPLSFEDWAAMAMPLGNAARSIEFVIGDWLVYGDRFAVQLPLPGFEDVKEAVYRVEPKRYERALLQTTLDRLTLRNYAYVARKIDRSCRHDALSFEHHRALAPLDTVDQQHWISMAKSEIAAGRHMSVRRLRRSIEAGRVLSVDELSIEKRAALKRDLQPILEIIHQL